MRANIQLCHVFPDKVCRVRHHVYNDMYMIAIALVVVALGFGIAALKTPWASWHDVTISLDTLCDNSVGCLPWSHVSEADDAKCEFLRHVQIPWMLVVLGITFRVMWLFPAVYYLCISLKKEPTVRREEGVEKAVFRF